MRKRAITDDASSESDREQPLVREQRRLFEKFNG
jgi:hypothetical protein